MSTNESEIATVHKNGDLEQLQRLAKMFAASGYFQDAKDLAQAAVKIQAGKELGFPPVVSMTGIFVVKGRVSLSAQLMAAALKNSGYSFRVLALENNGASIEFFDREKNSLGVSVFSETDARLAGLTGGDNWKKYPRNMFFARALSNGVRWFCPDALGGAPVYTPDELGVDVDASGAPLRASAVSSNSFQSDAAEELTAALQQPLSNGQVLPAVTD